MIEYDLNEADLNIEQTQTSDVNVTPETTTTTGANNNQQVFKYTAAGREVEEPLDVVLKRASQGYHYAQEMQSLKQQREEFENERRSVEELKNKWSQYDSYANENPDWADYVRTQWEQRQNGFDSNMQTDNTIPNELRNEIQELRSFKNEFQSFMSAQQKEREDSELNNQIDTVRNEYKDFDFNYSDPTDGKNLEMKVLEHMQTNGLNNFRAAFRDLYFDQILEKRSMQAKEQTAKTFTNQNKQGFVAEEHTSFRPNWKAQNIKNKSYDDLINEFAVEQGMI